MGFLRFRSSFKLFPGVRLNLSKSGVSTSIGRRGTWFTIGPRGTRTTIGIPGTGVSYTEQSSQRVGYAVDSHSESATFGLEQVYSAAGSDAAQSPDSTGTDGERWPNVNGSLAFLALALIVLALAVAFAMFRR
jgi:hypothetical protein